MNRIMIVDDAETIRKELASFLESCGYKVSALENFSHVVQDILQEKPDLVLLDINLPYADGYHICRELRKKSDIPILVVTSRNSEVDELMSMNLGAWEQMILLQNLIICTFWKRGFPQYYAVPKMHKQKMSLNTKGYPSIYSVEPCLIREKAYS